MAHTIIYCKGTRTQAVPVGDTMRQAHLEQAGWTVMPPEGIRLPPPGPPPSRKARWRPGLPASDESPAVVVTPDATPSAPEADAAPTPAPEAEEAPVEPGSDAQADAIDAAPAPDASADQEDAPAAPSDQ